MEEAEILKEKRSKNKEKIPVRMENLLESTIKLQ